jgi:hypothetical protein
MNDPLVVVAVASNLGIAFAYLGIGLYVTPKFSMAAPSRGSRLAKLCGLTFFVTCGITHLELAAHAAGEVDAAVDSQAAWLISWHGLVIHLVQGLAGLGFLALASRYLQVRIYNKQYYERVLDERIRHIESQLDRAG